jgi:hypothetical protein
MFHSLNLLGRDVIKPRSTKQRHQVNVENGFFAAMPLGVRRFARA